MSALTFCDVSCLYAPTGGGIRTYQMAKLRWFASQRHHRYVFVHPAAHATTQEIAPTAHVITVRGIPAGRGYRIPLHLPEIASTIARVGPDVLETGDPWFSGPMGLLARRRRDTGLVASFFHGNPIDTYVRPWAARGWLQQVRHRAHQRMDRYFFRVQRMYDLTVTSSDWIASLLRERGVRVVVRSPFGADAEFFEVGRRRLESPTGPRRRLLYAGRLQNDKGVDLLATALPRLLRESDAVITIAGIGPEESTFRQFCDPRVRLVGFVAGRAEMAALYREHDVLLAPGPYETFGLAALEATAAGLIVVGPDAGGTYELLSQLTHPYVFRAGDPADFAAVTLRAIAASSADADVAAHVALAERYGTWDDAIQRGIETYCRFFSHSTM